MAPIRVHSSHHYQCSPRCPLMFLDVELFLICQSRSLHSLVSVGKVREKQTELVICTSIGETSAPSNTTYRVPDIVFFVITEAFERIFQQMNLRSRSKGHTFLALSLGRGFNALQILWLGTRSPSLRHGWLMNIVRIQRLMIHSVGFLQYVIHSHCSAFVYAKLTLFCFRGVAITRGSAAGTFCSLVYVCEFVAGSFCHDFAGLTFLAFLEKCLPVAPRSFCTGNSQLTQQLTGPWNKT